MIINTRPEKLSRDLNYLAKSIDIELTNIPLTEVKIKDFLTQDEIELLKKISTFEGIVFTSSSACKYGIKKIQDFMEIDDLRSSIYAIGPATKKELAEHGLESFLPKEFNSKGIYKMLQDHRVDNILLVCGTNNEAILEEYFNRKIPKLEAYDVIPLKFNIAKLRVIPKASSLLIFNLATFKLIEDEVEDLSKKNFTWICASQRIGDYIRNRKAGTVVVSATPSNEDMLKSFI